MGGLAVGGALKRRLAPRLARERALVRYARLEIVIAVCALFIQFGLTALEPLLRVAYADGSGSWFGLVRALSSLLLVAVPAAAMGGTFPFAVHWLVGHAARAARDTGVPAQRFRFAVAVAARRRERVAADVARVYAFNTVGAIGGALAGSFLLVTRRAPASIVLGGILLVTAGALIACAAISRLAARVAVIAASLGLAAAGLSSPAWNPNLISSGLEIAGNSICRVFVSGRRRRRLSLRRAHRPRPRCGATSA